MEEGRCGCAEDVLWMCAPGESPHGPGWIKLMEQAGALSLDALMDDLEGVLRTLKNLHYEADPVTYKALQRAITWEPSLHVLSYMRFLESRGYLEYDRVADQIKLTEAGRAALEETDSWSEAARQAFAEQLGEQDDGTSTELAQPDEEPQAAPDMTVRPEKTNPEHMIPMNNLNASPSPSRHNATLYERSETVGSGGIGTVYRGRQTRLNREVAIKEIRDIFHVFADVQRDSIVERFIGIVQTQAKLSHPNIIQVLDVDTDAEYPFVVTQWAPGGNLRRLTEVEGRPPLAVSLRYFLQILHALSSAHDQGIIHGALKPENVVLGPSGNALITDFGIARVAERSKGSGNQVYVGVGTVTYMSPEQFRDPSFASVKSDLYSLGIMFYEMLTGKVPGRRLPMPSSFYPDIPRKLDDIFDRMSMDAEEDRYESIDEVLAELYASPDVMKILDKRAGVLFLRDPLKHGALGLSVEVHEEEGMAAALAEEPEALAAELEVLTASAPEVVQLAADPFDAGAHDQPAAEDEDAEDDAQDEPAGEPSAEGGDVLDKLDKYGAMFDEDDLDA
jgi:eukaryotic-like serine/threonine-protein kinase